MEIKTKPIILIGKGFVPVQVLTQTLSIRMNVDKTANSAVVVWRMY